MTTPHLQHSSGLHPNLQQLYDRACIWDCKLLFEEVDETTGETTMQHNLCAMRAKGVDYMFPAKYHGLTAKEELLIDLKLAALKAGFCLVIDGYEGQKRLHCQKKISRQSSCIGNLPQMRSRSGAPEGDNQGFENQPRP